MATRRYIELRTSAARGTDSLAADIMRHLHARRHLGKAAVISDQPLAMLSAARKQWLKLSRTIQKQRSSTLNADKILKYTNTISRMQHMQFTDKSPLEAPDADVYFLKPQSGTLLPLQCWSLYVVTVTDPIITHELLDQLPIDALIIDYEHALSWEAFDAEPKRVLEDRVIQKWHEVISFLRSYNIDIDTLLQSRSYEVEAMDDALDILLGVHLKFLYMASEFQRALELARPIRITKEMREHYDSLALLAHRVQNLLPGSLNGQFLETYNEDDTFFLYDIRKRQLIGGESLADAFYRHMAAGRYNLAAALRSVQTSDNTERLRGHQIATTYTKLIATI